MDARTAPIDMVAIFQARVAFSTFSSDSLSLIERRRWRQLSAHLGSNLVLGFGAAALGYYLGKHW